MFDHFNGLNVELSRKLPFTPLVHTNDDCDVRYSKLRNALFRKSSLPFHSQISIYIPCKYIHIDYFSVFCNFYQFTRARFALFSRVLERRRNDSDFSNYFPKTVLSSYVRACLRFSLLRHAG